MTPIHPIPGEQGKIPEKQPVWLDRSIASLGLFAATNKRTGNQRTVRLPDASDNSGDKIHRRVTISPNAALKEPIIQDLDFFIAFMQVANEQRTQNRDELRNPIAFTPYSILKRLKFRSDSNRNYKLLADWLQRMNFTGFISNNALFRADQGEFVSLDFVLFQAVLTKGKILPDGHQVADKCYVWLPDWMIANINQNHLFPIFEIYDKLQNRIAKALLFQLPAWFWGSRSQGFFTKRYREFCAALGIKPQRYQSDIRRRHTTALDELVSWGHLEGWSLEKTADGKDYKLILYPGEIYKDAKRKKFSQQLAKEPPNFLPEQGTAPNPHIARLEKWGFATADAAKLLDQLPEDQPVAEQLEYLESEIIRQGEGESGIRSPAGFIRDRLERNAPVPDHFQSSKKRYTKRQEEETQKAAEEAVNDHEEARLSELSPAE